MSPSKKFMTRWLLPLAGAVVVGGFFLFWQWPSQDDRPNAEAKVATPASDKTSDSTDIVDLYSQSETLTAQTETEDSTSAQQRFSAAYVELDASRQGNNVRMDLDIQKHWHINANPASFDFLIPTEVDIVADGAHLPAHLNYPTGDEIDVGLGDPIRVYSGQLELIGNLAEPGNDGPLQAQVRVQACNDSGLCLPPSTLSAPIADSAQASSP